MPVLVQDLSADVVAKAIEVLLIKQELTDRLWQGVTAGQGASPGHANLLERALLCAPAYVADKCW